jgi:ubiquinone/menaquinone biosynthesis C-methylase UbiE
MAADRRQMVHVLEGNHRRPMLSKLTRLVDPTTSSILDIGCGIGVLIPLLADRAPSASIVGIDMSYYLLSELKDKRMHPRATLVQAKVPGFPFKTESFDLAVAVQSFHEIFHFLGEEALIAAIDWVYNLLSENGAFIVLDHQNPGSKLVDIKLSIELMRTLQLFKERFKPRAVVYEKVDEYSIRMTMRDFYDFVTKIWALSTPLEEEEMHETHTPFSVEEFVHYIENAGFYVNYIDNLTPIEHHLDQYNITIQSDSNLPGRHFVVRAKKCE